MDNTTWTMLPAVKKATTVTCDYEKQNMSKTKDEASSGGSDQI